jgi:uncharacterized OB-fold protein
VTAPIGDSERDLPAPHHYSENEAFWAAANEGTLLIKHCRACERPHWYPREICPFCGSDDTEWRPSGGLGSIYSLSVVQSRSAPPLGLAYVALDEGVTLLTNIVDCDLAEVNIDDRVRLVFKRADDGQAIAMFTPATRLVEH